ncbi:hypothetical protein HK405_000405, partial [Cladochytrium tenue]
WLCYLMDKLATSKPSLPRGGRGPLSGRVQRPRLEALRARAMASYDSAAHLLAAELLGRRGAGGGQGDETESFFD